jgi:hypothetical protein
MREPGASGCAPTDIAGPAALCGAARSGSVSPERLSILFVSRTPTSPPRFGAQAGRMDRKRRAVATT